MADKETGFVIPVSAYADKDSAKAAISELTKGVLSSLKDGYIEVPAEIKASYARGSKELDKAQKDVIKIYEKMSKEGFSSSVEDLDNLIEKYRKFKSLAGKEGKGNSKQTKWLTKTIGETLQPYLAQKRELDKLIANFEESIAKLETSTKKSTKSSGKKPRNFGTHSKEEIDANIKQEKNRKYKGWESTGPKTPTASVDAGRTNAELMRLSEYSAHGSKWASALAKAMEIEQEKAAQTLVSWIDPHYKVGTRTGKEQNPIDSGNQHPETTERQFLSDTIKSVKAQLKTAIKDLESGSEEITLDTLKEYAAVIKVLTKAIGKTTEDAEKTITGAIESVYTSNTEVKTKKGIKSTQTKLGGTDREDGKQKGVGVGHENTQKLVSQLYTAMKQWDSEIIADTIAKGMVLGIDEAVKAVWRRGDSSNTTSSKFIDEVKLSDDYKAEVEKLVKANDTIFEGIRQSNKITDSQIDYDKIEHVREAVSDSAEKKLATENKDINRDVAGAVKKDMTTGFNTDTNANLLIDTVKQILKVVTPKTESKKSDAIGLPATSKDLYKKLTDATRLALPKADRRRRKISKGLIDENPLNKSLPVIQKSISTALAVVPGEFAKTIKEAIHPTEEDFSRYSGGDITARREAKERAEYEARLRQLANEANARKEARKTKGNAGSKIPKTIVPEEPLYEPKLEKSHIYASPFNQGFLNSLRHAFDDLTGATERYADTLKANADDQDAMAAERVVTYGLNNGRNPNDTGDIAGMRRILQLYRTNKSSIDDNPELQQRIQLTKGREVDTTEITKALNKALSGNNMRNAQMGGSIPRQILGAMTGFIGMPSLEKSRAQADGLNQVLGNINKALQSVLVNIQTKETELAGMEERGEVRFNKDGFIEEGSSASYKLLADLEEEKLVLDTIQADLLANEKIIQRSGGNYAKMAKHLKFMSPVLRENNGILRNITSGLDKNGKALKFQSRLAEILNYTFQLMSRSIGQMFKNWLVQLNPITQIKKAFSDFTSYNTKWQRTMNVVKYNLRDIIAPIMEKIAQLLVNMIGFADIILQKVQAAFGSTPISLFDQENAKKFKDEVEQINNITAGFDELHDIGTDSDKDPNNLLGDIYKPELSQEWVDLAERIGNLFAGIITGDLGFSEVMKEILGIAWQGIKTLWSEILWPFIQNTIWPAIKDNWLEILGWILAAFLAWKGLNLLGDLLLNALFGKLTFSGIKNFLGPIFQKLGSGLWNLLGLSTFGQQMQVGFLQAFKGQGLIGAIKGGGASLGSVFAQAFLAVAGVAIAGISYAKGFDMAADDTSYNIGLMEAGGDEKDKKKSTGAYATSMLGGAAGGALVGLAIGGPIGAAIGAGIGAIAGAITTSLAPAFEELEVQAREANNEMQKIEYYEGQVQGYSTQVTNLTELQKVLNDTLKLQTEKVYEEGEQLGITKERMNELVTAVQNGTFHTGMLTGAEMGLKDSLIQLDTQQTKNKEATEKLEAAKRKLQKAELDLAIAEDIAAGNFEMAAARVEYAVAAEIYDVEEGTKKMVQIAKEGSAEQAAAMLRDMSPDLQAKFQKEYSTTDKGLNELTDLYFQYSKDEREYFLQNLTGEVEREMKNRVSAIEQAVKNAPWWQRLLDIGNDGKIFGKYYVDVPSSSSNTRTVPAMAVGTNYVPNDGLAYLHQGEAVVPKKYNNPYQQPGLSAEEREYMSQMIKTMESLDSTMKQGINVNGQFVQRGSDLVATVEKANNRMSNNILNNRVYAR